ncbi:MAG: DUF4301 family protein [Deltaproteobacteria bacterium]|nr:DUF4301 family protein [Deltaproteobacteria bacterium]
MREAMGAWSAEDRQQIIAHGLSVAEVERQLGIFRRGVPPIRLNRPCRVGDGIVTLPEEERPALLSDHEGARRTVRLMKFTPASGAASRMFREWYRCLDSGCFPDGEARAAFARDLPRYAFFPDLKERVAAAGGEVESWLRNGEDAALLRFILTGEGLDYGSLPKALLKFHACPDGNRTALEEHLVEAAQYARDAGDLSRIHFTVSREHEGAVRSFLSRIVPAYETRIGTRFAIGLSTQDPETDTIAADPECRPFRGEDGRLVFRPGGHGALLANLDTLDADVIFLKNIDNIVPDRLKAETVLWKKLLAGYLVRLQAEIFTCLRVLEAKSVAEGELARIADFCTRRANISLPDDFRDGSSSEKRAHLFGRLNRPLRVCGMVKNEGEPGGGPFWVDDPDGKGGSSLQIVEEPQIDPRDPGQRAVWSKATHFNPVDLVCGVRDFRGRKFALAEFVDPATTVITRKSEKGRELLALERPGLWNGSMAFWNTVFIEVPIATFNPVKTVTDLLRPQHMPC